jgi:hypothetical protein
MAASIYRCTSYANTWNDVLAILLMLHSLRLVYEMKACKQLESHLQRYID